MVSFTLEYLAIIVVKRVISRGTVVKVRRAVNPLVGVEEALPQVVTEMVKIVQLRPIESSIAPFTKMMLSHVILVVVDG